MAFGGFFGGGGKNNDSSSSSSSSQSSTDSTSLFTSLPTTSSGSSSDVKSRLQTAITTESNIINAKLLIQKINDNCFDLCVPEPGSSLSSREQGCLSACMEKYIEGWSAVSKVYVGRLQRESVNMPGGAMGGIGGGGKEMF